jgi:hypothetical protein
MHSHCLINQRCSYQRRTARTANLMCVSNVAQRYRVSTDSLGYCMSDLGKSPSWWMPLKLPMANTPT